MTFDPIREAEFLAKVQDARTKLREFYIAMRQVGMTRSKEEALEDFNEDFNESLFALERRCIKNLKR